MPKILTLVKYPNSTLKTKAKTVEKIDSEILTLIDDMIATMYFKKGIGLAANQVNVLLRIMVIDINWRSENNEITNKNPLVFINPEIIAKSEELSVYNEGCLSLPEIYEEIERPSSVTVKFLNKDGKEETIVANNLLATCLQHEIDHLDGKLFIDHLSRLKRNFILKKYKKLSTETE